MDIHLHNITVRELCEGYDDNREKGIFSYGGKLDIRPPYQREFVYGDKKRQAVIESITNDFPLNVMYWAVRDDGGFEIIDGQQRTISICQYINDEFSFNASKTDDPKYFTNLQNDEQKQILDYELTIYRCSGDDSEKLKWFKIINIAGEVLTSQELLNSVYFGKWLSDAKHYFSKPNCAAHNMAKHYVKATAINQEYLEIALKWISNNKVDGYMAKHQGCQNANELWNYFRGVINWVEATFEMREKLMKKVNWGSLYDIYKDKQLDTDQIERKTIDLLKDDEVKKQSGVYAYILSGDEKSLDLRSFSDNVKQKFYEIQNGICVKCKKHFKLSEMEADHIIPWYKGGKTTEENCQLLCMIDNRSKSGK